MKYLDIHTHISVEDADVISITNLLPGHDLPESLFSIGLHPWVIDKDEIETQLKSVALSSKNSNCVAIGECGLDRPNFKKTGRFAENDEDAVKKGFELQSEVFVRQIGIANIAKRPVIIHCVRAFPELLHIHKTEKPTTPWLIHGFRGSEEEAKALTDKGIYLSFGKTILYDNPTNIKMKKIFSEMPEDKLFLETDNVDKPERDIKEVYEVAAELRKISIDEMQEIIKKNFEQVFSLS